MKKGLFLLMVFSGFIFPCFVFAETWNQVNTSGFGDPGNSSSRSMVYYYNSLYAGTVNNSTGAEVWKYDGATWSQVNTDSFGDINNKASLSMAVFDYNLYVGTQNTVAGTEVWRYDLTNWTQVNTNGFGDAMNRLSASMAVYNNNLYVGTRNPSTGTEIWRYDGTSWTQVNTDGFGDLHNLRSFRMVVYKGSLYTGTENATTGTEVWRYDGTNWTQVNADGFGDANNTGSFSMAVDENYLYAGTENKVTGTAIWRYDGTNWTQINPDGFGDLNNAISFSMAALGTLLFVGTDNPTTGTEIWRYDGTTWTQANIDGFGDASNASSVSMTVYNNSLYVGIENTAQGAAVFSMPVQAFAATAGDDFNDNKMDPTKWSADHVFGRGLLKETNGRLEYTCPKGTASDEASRPWILTRVPYNSDWEMQIDVGNLTIPSADNQESSFGIIIFSPHSWNNYLYADLYATFNPGGAPHRGFYGKMTNGNNSGSVDSGDLGVTHGAVRMVFDSGSKVVTVFYDTDPGDGYQWIPYGSILLSVWNLAENDQFPVYVYGYSEYMKITSGELYGDTFRETGAVPKAVRWTNHEELGGGESRATGVASLGLKSYVAVSGKEADGKWYGQLKIYKPSGALLWEPDPFDLQGGRTTQVAVSGSKVYVTGYQGIAGSGTEKVFVRAYDASTKSFKWEYTGDAPNAGLYPLGVAALGNYVVGFFNTDTGVLRGKLFGLNPVTGGLKWSSEFGDDINPSNKVNAIAMKGSAFAAAGYNEDVGGIKWFNVRAFSAVNGDSDWGYGFHPGGEGKDNEALAIAWKGSIVGVAGYVSPDLSTRIGSVAAVIISPQGSTKLLHTDYVEELGNDSRCNQVVVSGTKIYAAGYGLDGSEQKAFVGAYDARKEDPGALLWSNAFDLTSLGGMITTGMTLVNKRVYVAGYGLGLSGTPEWFVKAYDLNGNAKWFDDLNLNGGKDSKAYGIAASSSAVVPSTSIIVAVGQAKNGPDGAKEMAVRVYKP
jgi:outer membrane protein assembly factor BamB